CTFQRKHHDDRKEQSHQTEWADPIDEPVVVGLASDRPKGDLLAEIAENQGESEEDGDHLCDERDIHVNTGSTYHGEKHERIRNEQCDLEYAVYAHTDRTHLLISRREFVPD